MKKLGWMFVLLMLVVMVGCSQPSKDEVINIVKMLPDFQEVICYFSSGDFLGIRTNFVIRKLEIGMLSISQELAISNVVI